MRAVLPLLLLCLPASACVVGSGASSISSADDGLRAVVDVDELDPGDPDYGDPDVDEDHSVGEAILLYVPNRLLDVFDVVRARVRFGPGAAVDVRVTRIVSLFVGRYQTYYVGLPGPRNRPEIKWPIGSESWEGFGVAEAEDSVDRVWDGPDYGPGEIGVGLQVLLVGADVGVDPIEAIDLVLGLLTIDIRGDDL